MPCCYQSSLSNLAQTWDLEASWKYLLSFFYIINILGFGKNSFLNCKTAGHGSRIYECTLFFSNHCSDIIWGMLEIELDLTQRLSWISINWLRQVKTSWCGEWRCDMETVNSEELHSGLDRQQVNIFGLDTGLRWFDISVKWKLPILRMLTNWKI